MPTISRLVRIQKTVREKVISKSRFYSTFVNTGHLIQISEGMFGWHILVWQPLTSMKMPLLRVPSGGQGHRSRSNIR